MRRIELRLTETESEELDLLCKLTNRRRADAARVAIAEWLKVLKRENTADALGFIERVLPKAPEATRRVPVFARAPNTVSIDPTAGPLVGEAEVPERVVSTTFFDEEPSNPKVDRARAVLALAEAKTKVKPFV